MVVKDRFQKIRLIGTGGFGEVWLCRRERDGAQLAMKQLSPTLDDSAIRRFVREVRILSSLDHPNIVRVLSKHLLAAPYMYVMPLYQRSLTQELPSLIGNEHRIQPIVERILDGLEYAHAQGIVHRDLKPQNILMNADTDVVISDFGLGRQFDAESTRQTQTGYGLGTPLYMAPEQLSDAKNADQRCDIFSFGRILYELFTGPLSFAPMDFSSVSAPIAVIIGRCTHADPARRYQSVAELKMAWRLLSDAAAEASQAEELDTLLVDLSAGGAAGLGKVRRLIELLAPRLDDPDLVHKIVMSLAASALQALWQLNRDVAAGAIRQYVEMAAAQGWPFDYTNSIAAKCKELLEFVDDPVLRAAIIWCVIVVGVDHNRWAVMRTAAALLAGSKQPPEVAALVERLSTLRQGQLGALAGYVDKRRLDPMIRTFFRDE